MNQLHNEVMERLEYLADSCEELDIDDKIQQLKLIFEGISKQRDPDLMVEEIAAVAYYSLHDPEATLYVNIGYLTQKGEQDV